MNIIAGASTAHSEEKEPEGKTEILNAVLESLPEPEVKEKPKRRRATSANLTKAKNTEK